MRGLARLVALCCLVLATMACAPAFAGKRVALVIGNSDYASVPKLPNPGNDAEDVGAALKDLGFDVVVSKDLTLEQFETTLSRFRGASQDAEIGLLFYAGHAIQYNHENYLIPVDALIKQPELLNKQTVTFDEVEKALKGVRGAQIMILDACRDNPFKDLLVATRGVSPARGLESIPIQSDDLAVLFSTRANAVALDGDGRNSPFSKVLIDQLKQPGHQDISWMLTRVVAKVKDSTGGKQSPELRTSIAGEYGLDLVNDRSEWDAVKDTHDPGVLRTFAGRYPNSPFRIQAERLADQFERARAQRQQEEQSVCALGQRLLDISVAMRDRAGLEHLAAENTCPRLKPDIDAALQSVATLTQQSRCERLDDDLRRAAAARDDMAVDALRPDAAMCPGFPARINRTLDALRLDRERERQEVQQQKACSDDAAKLEALRAVPGPARIGNIQRFASSPALCDRVRDAANDLVAALRDEDARSARDAAQARVCAAEARTLDGLVGQGARGAIEALGRARRCETLDVAGGLARLDDLARQRDQQALAACASVDVGRLRNGGDEKGLNDVAARCPSRRGDTAAALETIKARQRVADACRAEQVELRGDVKAGQAAAVAALRARAVCPDLDLDGAEREIAKAACDTASLAVARADGRDEAALGRLSSDASFCPAARDLASRRLAQAVEARRVDDASCEAATADASAHGDVAKLRRLSADPHCARRLDGVTAATEAVLRQAKEAAATARCAADGTELARTPSDESALQALAERPDLCEGVRAATVQRLKDVAALHQREDQSCDDALSEAAARHDGDAMQRAASDLSCLRRKSAATAALAALRTAEKQRIAGAQRKLVQVGCYAGPESGVVDAGTRLGVARYWTAKHGEGPAPTTIGFDLSSEIDALFGIVCPVAPPAAPAVAPVKAAPAAPGPQAKAEPEADDPAARRQHAIEGQPVPTAKRRAPADKGRTVGAAPLAAPAVEGPRRSAHRRPPSWEEPSEPAPRRRAAPVFAEPVPRAPRLRREYAAPQLAPVPAAAPAETAGPKPHIFY